MGVIQNSMNQMLATVMGGALGIKHIQGQQSNLKAAELSELADLPEKVSTNEKYINALKNDAESQEKEIEIVKAGTPDNPITNPEDINYTELQIAEKALKETEGKLESAKMRQKLWTARQKELENKYIGGKK